MQTTPKLKENIVGSVSSIAQRQQLQHELLDNFTGGKAKIKNAEITINGQAHKANPEVSQNAPIFDGVSEQDVMTYFKQLTGEPSLPKAELLPRLKDLDGNVSIRYTVKEGDLTYNLRNGSSSVDVTRARWTIEITGTSGQQVGEKVLTRPKVEIKFR